MPSDKLRTLVDELFVAWSSSDPDKVEPHFHRDAYLWDSVNGGFTGWPAIRGLYEESLKRWNNLSCKVVQSWPARDNSIAFVWESSGLVADDRFGREKRGALCTFEGMAFIEFENDLVMREIEYFDRTAPARSIGFEVDRVIFR
jgi:hypothetical protein